VKLLFDQNLSRRLVGWLSDVFPGSAHVASVGLDQATPRHVWDHVAGSGFVM
jgi:predicted nuclease of predicted toxin-antitoxin system